LHRRPEEDAEPAHSLIEAPAQRSEARPTRPPLRDVEHAPDVRHRPRPPTAPPTTATMQQACHRLQPAPLTPPRAPAQPAPPPAPPGNTEAEQTHLHLSASGHPGQTSSSPAASHAPCRLVPLGPLGTPRVVSATDPPLNACLNAHLNATSSVLVSTGDGRPRELVEAPTARQAAALPFADSPYHARQAHPSSRRTRPHEPARPARCASPTLTRRPPATSAFRSRSATSDGRTWQRLKPCRETRRRRHIARA